MILTWNSITSLFQCLINVSFFTAVLTAGKVQTAQNVNHTPRAIEALVLSLGNVIVMLAGEAITAILVSMSALSIGLTKDLKVEGDLYS